MFIFDSPIYQAQDLFNEKDLKGLESVKEMYVLNGLHPDLKITLPLLPYVNVQGNDTFTFMYEVNLTILGKEFSCVVLGNTDDSLPLFSEETMQGIKEHIESSIYEEAIDSLVWDDNGGLMVSEDETL